MNKIKTIIHDHKYAIIWTGCYIIITWAVLYFMFNFSIFNASQWQHLFRAQLRGFGGFVFGIMLLAALPLYIATTTLIIRTKKPLLSIQLPKLKIPSIFKPANTPTPVESCTPPESDTPKLAPDDEVKPISDLPDDMPAELRHAFVRARNNVGRIQTSAFNSASSIPGNIIPNTPDIASDTLPLPTDFDIDTMYDTPQTFDTMPTFTEISFDTPTNDTPSDITPTPSETGAEYIPDNSELINHLNKSGQSFSVHDDIIITDTHAIITHSDPDFWVADHENWFAAGRICQSPIIHVQDIAEQHARTPAIYLLSKNILNLNDLIEQWQNDGLTVISDLSEL